MQNYFKTDEKSSKVSLSIKGIFHFIAVTHLNYKLQGGNIIWI